MAAVLSTDQIDQYDLAVLRAIAVFRRNQYLMLKARVVGREAARVLPARTGPGPDLLSGRTGTDQAVAL